MKKRVSKPRRRKGIPTPGEEVVRVRLPGEGEVLGLCENRLGGSKMIVRCLDGKTRNCRIPGRLKRRLWIREGDILLVKPWEFGGETRGDVLYKYRILQVKVLRKQGLLKQLDEFDETF